MSFRTDLGLPDAPPLGTILVHFFKPSGKWYTSEDVPFLSRSLVSDSLRDSLAAHLKGKRLHGMLAACLEFPGHLNDHPVLHVPSELRYVDGDSDAARVSGDSEKLDLLARGYSLLASVVARSDSGSVEVNELLRIAEELA